METLNNSKDKTFTLDFMKQNKGCYTEEELMKCSFMKNKEITLSNILLSEIKLKDKYWFVCKKLLTKEQNQLIAIGVAEIVLEIYENKYPDNKAPREAIQTAKDYLADVIDLDTLRTKRDAAYAAAAADAADAAYAAYAADAADAAVYAAAADAADAAYAADAAAYAAAYAADAAAYAAYAKKSIGTKDFQKLLLDYLINYCNSVDFK